MYRERLLKRISIAFIVIAVVIACLGLLGLVTFNAQRRTKEIGIRKVLGATVSQIVAMLFREFVPLVFFSMVLAFPIAYYLAQNFLSEYPSRIGISKNSFLMVGGMIILMTVITVGHQSLKAVRKNAVESIKVE